MFRGISILLSLITAMATPIAIASTDNAKEQIKGALKEASKARKLKSSNSIVMFSPTGDSVVVNGDNPRWVMKGQLFDMWQNKKIASVSELESAEIVMPVNKMNIANKKLFDATINLDKEKELIVFIDPFVDSSKRVVSIIKKFVLDYQVRFIFTAVQEPESNETTNSHIEKLFSFACQVEGLSSSETLDLIIMDKITFDNEKVCGKEKIVASYGLSQFLQIKTSPTLVASNEIYIEGMPKSLMTWLSENMK